MNTPACDNPEANSPETFHIALYGDHPIRIRKDSAGQPWFLVQDVCSILGLRHHPSRVVESLNRNDVALTRYIRGRRHNFVNASGLLCLVLRSRKPEAAAFQNWMLGTLITITTTDASIQPASIDHVVNQPKRGIAALQGRPAKWPELMALDLRNGVCIRPEGNSLRELCQRFRIFAEYTGGLLVGPTTAREVVYRLEARCELIKNPAGRYIWNPQG